MASAKTRQDDHTPEICVWIKQRSGYRIRFAGTGLYIQRCGIKAKVGKDGGWCGGLSGNCSLIVISGDPCIWPIPIIPDYRRVGRCGEPGREIISGLLRICKTRTKTFLTIRYVCALCLRKGRRWCKLWSSVASTCFGLEAVHQWQQRGVLCCFKD